MSEKRGPIRKSLEAAGLALLGLIPRHDAPPAEQEAPRIIDVVKDEPDMVETQQQKEHQVAVRQALVKDQEQAIQVRQAIDAMLTPQEVFDAVAYENLSQFLQKNLPKVELQKVERDISRPVKDADGSVKFVDRYYIKLQGVSDPLEAQIDVRIMNDGTYVIGTGSGFDLPITVGESKLKETIEKKVHLAGMKADEMKSANPGDQQAIKQSIIAYARDAGIPLDEDITAQEVEEEIP